VALLHMAGLENSECICKIQRKLEVAVSVSMTEIFPDRDSNPRSTTQALVSFKKYMPPPLPYFKVNNYPFPLSHFASIFFAYLFESRSGQNKDYKIGMCCFSVKHAALRRKSKDWLARNQDNVPEWGDMFLRRLLFLSRDILTYLH
jgi:hypothetical protein